MLLLGLYLGHVSVSKPCPYLVFSRATGICMCGIGRKRCSSRPSHDTLGFRSCSQVTLSVLLCCPRWVALVPSSCLWCREEHDCHQVCCVWLGPPRVRVAACLSRITIGVETVSCVGSRTTPTTKTSCWVVLPMLTLYLSVSHSADRH